jgi:hypothetical protein
MALLAPGIAVYVLTARPSVLREPRTIAGAVVALAAGLAVYLYVPIRAAADPPIQYDYNPTTLELVIRYVLGRDFADQMTFLTPGGPVEALGQLGSFWSQLAEGLGAPIALGLLALALVGFAALLRDRAWRTAWLLAATGGLTLYARLTYVNGDLDRYALYPVAVLGILAAVGAERLWRVVARRTLARRPASRAVVGLVPAAALVVPLALAWLNADGVRTASARCYLDDLAARVPARTGIVSWWSFVTPIWYGQAVEGYRPDVEAVSAATGVVDEVERLQAEGRPVVIIQTARNVERVRAAGYPMVEESFCGVGAWRITGPAGR